MGGCSNCDGSCASCGSCRMLELNMGELAVLEQLRSIPFLPVARRADSKNPVCPEISDSSPEEVSLILLCLEKKGLISIDYDLPLKGFDYSVCPAYPVHGSLALTLRGQQTLDFLEIHGTAE